MKKNFFTFFSLLSGLSFTKICKKCFFFIGTLPINFSRRKINFSKFKEIFLLEKSDGIRYLFLIGNKKCFLLDRNLIFFGMPANFEKIFKNEGTILDGELCFNLLKQSYDYLFYDIFCFEYDWRISTWDIKGRSGLISKLLEKIWMNKDLSTENFKKKDFFSPKNIQNLFKKILGNFYSNDHLYFNQNREKGSLCNKNDGLIFSCSKSVYFIKKADSTFKWKYEEGNSIDFFANYEKRMEKFGGKNYLKTTLSCQNTKKYLLYILEKERFIFPSLFFKYKKDSRDIEEFNFNRQKGKWFLSKKRPDKKNPNSAKVVLNTLENICETIHKNELIDRLTKQFLRQNRGKIMLNKIVGKKI